jgi:uncharacterized membrane protein
MQTPLIECRARISVTCHLDKNPEHIIMNNASTQTNSTTQASGDNLPITRMVARTCYFLFIVGFFLPPVALAAIVINLLRRHRARGTWLESHFRWQLRTYLISLGLAIVSLLPAALLTGLAVVSPDLAESSLMIPLVLIIFVVFFFLIRMFRGLGAMSRNQPV